MHIAQRGQRPNTACRQPTRRTTVFKDTCRESVNVDRRDAERRKRDRQRGAGNGLGTRRNRLDAALSGGRARGHLIKVRGPFQRCRLVLILFSKVVYYLVMGNPE